MKWTMLLAAALLLGSAQAQDRVVIQSQKNGKQVMTVIEKLSPVVPPVKPEPRIAPPRLPAPGEDADPRQVAGPCAAPVILLARDWRCGRWFTDDCGRRWQLVFGPPLSVKPPQVSGWVMRTVDQRLYFFTVTGSMYIQVAVYPPFNFQAPALPGFER